MQYKYVYYLLKRIDQGRNRAYKSRTILVQMYLNASLYRTFDSTIKLTVMYFLQSGSSHMQIINTR